MPTLRAMKVHTSGRLLAAGLIACAAVIGTAAQALADPVYDTTTLAFGPHWTVLGGIPSISAAGDVAVVDQDKYDAIESPAYQVPSLSKLQPCGTLLCQEFSDFKYTVTPAGWYQAPAGAPTAGFQIVIVDVSKNTDTLVASYDNTLPPGTAVNGDISL